MMSTRFRLLGFAAALCALLALCLVAGAQVVAPEDAPWQNSWTGYFWVPGYNGDAVLAGNPVDVDLSISDTVDSMTDYFESGFSGHYEGNKTPWGIIADVNYWRMSGDVATEAGPVEISPRQMMIELAGARTVSQKTVGEFATQRLQVLLGARYNLFKVRADGSGFNQSASKNFIDPMVGARIMQALSPQWGVSLRVDLAGFGVGSDLATNIVGTVGYNLGKNRTILLGWKYYNLDFEDGSTFKWDVAQSGPFLGFQTRF